MEDFFKNHYKKYIIIPIVLLIPMLFLIFIFPGISPGIDLTGGNVLILRSENPFSEQQILDILRQEFNLTELKVSTIDSPTGYGALIQYGKDPIISEAENLISQATLNIEDETVSIDYSKQSLLLLGKETKEYSNAKLALLDAQDAIAEYKETFELKLQNILVEKLGLGENAEFQKKEISPTLGSASLQSALFISIIGAILIVIIIFISFRQAIPSVAIIQAMVFDVIAGLAGMAILGVPLSLTTIPALLMLVGYSVDTDIMLTSRMLKEKTGTPGERATRSMKTGLTMTGTTLAALCAMVIVSYFYQIEVIYQIAAILLFGLIGDVVSTWLMNAPILLWFVGAKK
jgi:preprotein translocase subunit SecF